MQNLYIIGAGMGHISDLTEYAADIIKNADIVYGSARLYEQYKVLNTNISAPKYSEIESVLEKDTLKNTVLLVSGDVLFYSIAKKIQEKFNEKYNIELVPGISSMQYFLSKLNIIDYNVKAVSMHGRNNSCLGPVSYNEYTFMLTGGDKKADNIINELYNAGLDYVYVYAGENLHSDDERIVSGKISDMLDYKFSSLTVLLIHNKEYVNPKTNLRDNDFIRGKAPMTKEDIRWLSACYLGIEDNDIVYDVGAGTGSCAIEFAGHAKEGLVYAVEKEDEAFELINTNKKNLKRHNVISIKGSAPEILINLPAPDKVFIGGSSKTMKDIFKIVYEKNNHVKITVTAITLETIAAATDAFKDYNIEPDIVCINSAKSKKAGPYHMMMGNNPVYIITGRL